jgi:hypothetical protein
MFVAARREKPPGRKTEALEEFRIGSPVIVPPRDRKPKLRHICERTLSTI